MNVEEKRKMTPLEQLERSLLWKAVTFQLSRSLQRWRGMSSSRKENSSKQQIVGSFF